MEKIVAHPKTKHCPRVSSLFIQLTTHSLIYCEARSQPKIQTKVLRQLILLCNYIFQFSFATAFQ